jgi:SAM-dependent methyltransferase
LSGWGQGRDIWAMHSPGGVWERFSDRVADYARHRPGYPGSVLAEVRRETGLRPDRVVADVGSGTGLSSRLFLEAGHRVVGVEPNAAMRRAAESSLAGWPAFRSVAGTAESTTLAEASVDLVVSAQAFHWFDAEAARGEFARILRPPGWVALIWNTRRPGATSFLREYEGLLVRYGTDYDQVRHDRLEPGLLDVFFGGGHVSRSVPNEQVLDLEGLKGRVLSSSYTPAAGDPARAALLEAVARLFARHERGGRVRLEYDTEIHIGKVL